MSLKKINTSYSHHSCTRLIFTGCLVIFSCAVHAQKDSSYVLREVNIYSAKVKFNSGLLRKDFDSTDIAAFSDKTLNHLLNDKSALYIKSYGSGGLSTIGLRGGSAYHTAIIWNGFTLASPLNGLTDLSLLNNSTFNEISIQSGGTSYLWGSGAVSGSIHLNNTPSFNSGLKIRAGFSAGSFSAFSEQIGVSYGTDKFFISSRFYSQQSENNFSYFNYNTETQEKLLHGEIDQSGLLNEFYYLTGKKSSVNLAIWHSNSNRQVPPSLYQVNHDAVQKDINTRFFASWSHSGFFETSIRSGMFLEKINYNDDFLIQPSDNKSKSFTNEATLGKSLGSKNSIRFGINNTYSTVDSSANFSKASENRFALFLLYRYLAADKIEFSFSTRKEISTLKSSPLTVAGGINVSPVRHFQLRAAASTVYRNPTLNDLFWVPGGNKDLKPESGYSIESGFSIKVPSLISKQTSSSLDIDVTAFYKKINDWIIWYPSTSFNWTPQNLLSVKSRGIETSLHYKIKISNFSSGFSIDYYYTLSTNEKSLYANDASVDKQLIYVPRHSFNFSLNAGYKNFAINFHHSFTGIRYTTSDNSSLLKSYQVSNIEMRKNFIGKKHYIHLFFRIRNLFDAEYQSVLSRPMPGRSYEGGVGYEFGRGKKNKE